MNTDSSQFGKQFLNWKPTSYKGDESQLGSNYRPKVQGADSVSTPAKKPRSTRTDAVDWSSL